MRFIPSFSLLGAAVLSFACSGSPSFVEKTRTTVPPTAGQGTEVNANAEAGPVSGAPETVGTNSTSGGGILGSGPKAPTADGTEGTRTAVAGNLVDFSTTQKQGKVDILMVVDSSGSMAFAQAQLASKFDAFARKLSDANLDFRMGVTTVDVCNVSPDGQKIADQYCPEVGRISNANAAGALSIPKRGSFLKDPQSGQGVLVPGAGFVDAFKRVALAGTSGSAMEHGLTAARMAVDLAKSGQNGSFMRPNANLSVIVLSDEEDDGVQTWCEDAWGRTSLTPEGTKDLNACKLGGGSPFLDKYGVIPYALNSQSPRTQYKFTADNFVSYLNRSDIKGPGKFRVSAITSLRGADGNIDCENPLITGSKPTESGTNYIKAAQLTGGSVQNICATDWTEVMSTLGQNTSELASKIELPAGKFPFPGTLEVFVNGESWDATKFEYESRGNFLTFKQLPPSGSSINIKYKESIIQ